MSSLYVNRSSHRDCECSSSCVTVSKFSGFICLLYLFTFVFCSLEVPLLKAQNCVSYCNVHSGRLCCCSFLPHSLGLLCVLWTLSVCSCPSVRWPRLSWCLGLILLLWPEESRPVVFSLWCSGVWHCDWCGTTDCVWRCWYIHAASVLCNVRLITVKEETIPVNQRGFFKCFHNRGEKCCL